MARYQSFTVATDVRVYFCDPRSPWQRGSNTNGLLRQYFPRGTNLSRVSQAQLNALCELLPFAASGAHSTIHTEMPHSTIIRTIGTQVSSRLTLHPPR